MPDGNQEQERLKRLRERQLADRDPQIKQRQFQRVTAQREREQDKTYSLGRIWGDIPYVWKGGFYGLILGTLVMLVLPIIWASSLTFIVSIVAIVVLTLFGVMVGRAIDTREEIKNLIR